VASLSNLIVTNRLPFIDWWTWNITKQTRLPDEVILATNHPFELEEDAEAYEYTVRAKLAGIPLHTIFMPPSKTVGELRQAALDAAVGDFITWSDDDDWYHPDKLRWLLEQAEAGWRIAIFPLTHRLFLHNGALYQWAIWRGLHLPATIYRAEDAHAAQFPAMKVGEDGLWTAQIVKTHNITPEQVNCKSGLFPPLVGGIILVHGHNAFQNCHPANECMGVAEQLAEGDGEALDLYPPPGIDRAEWATLHLQLHALRLRLHLINDSPLS
jgi:hypothetical protein